MSLSLSPDMRTFVSGACDASAKVRFVALQDKSVSLSVDFSSCGTYVMACAVKPFLVMNLILTPSE